MLAGQSAIDDEEIEAELDAILQALNILLTITVGAKQNR